MKQCLGAVLCWFIFQGGIAAQPQEISAPTSGMQQFEVSLTTTEQILRLGGLTPHEPYRIFLPTAGQEPIRLAGLYPLKTGAAWVWSGVATDTILEFAIQAPPNYTARVPIEITRLVRPSFAFTAEKALASIEVTLNNDATQLVNGVFRGGSCFETYEPTTTGDPRQIGTFSNGTAALGMADGIVLSTGLAEQAEGPNNFSFTLYEYNLQYTDPDIATLAGNNDIFDIAVLEFDFRPTRDEISFEYVFASEEYCEIVSPGFNDVFAFFISGPGIDGPFSNNAENIARVPSSNQVVSVSSINHFTNSLYYRNNTPASFGDACSDGMPVAPNDIEFDGLTTVLTASSPVIPCQTYHLKIVVADVGDDIYDSAIFLNAGSFNAGLVNVSQENFGTFEADNQTLIEGCGRSQLIFSRTNDDVSQDLWVTYTVSPLSTAEEGVDFVALPDSFLIAAGQLQDTLILQSIADGIPEGNETIFLYVENSCDCQGAFIELQVTDAPVFTSSLPAELSFCATDSLAIGPTASGGVAPYSFLWSDMSTDSIFLLTANSQLPTYRVSVTDACGQRQVHDIAVAVDSVTASLSGVYAACNASQIPVILSGAEMYEVVIERNGSQETFSGITGDTLWLSPNGVETFNLLSVIGDGCSGFADGMAEVTGNEIQVDSLVNDVSCFGGANGSINLDVGQAPPPYAYQWSDGNLSGNAPQNLAAGPYRVTVSDAAGCQYVFDFHIDEPDQPVDLVVSAKTSLTCAQSASVSLMATGGTGNYTYVWSDAQAGTDRQFATPGLYSVTATDSNGCSESLEVTIEDERDPPAATLDPVYVLDCNTPVRTISPATVQNSFLYRWVDATGDTIATNDEVTLAEPGAYQLIVRDPANGCRTETPFTVSDDREFFQVAFAQARPLTCREDATDLLALFADPPTDLELEWASESGPLGTPDQNPVAISLSDGPAVYLSSFSPATGCRQVDTFYLVTDTLAPVVSLDAAADLSCLVTESELSVRFPDGDWIYAWQTVEGTLLGPTNSVSVRAGRTGTYRVMVTDTTNGCSNIAAIELNEDFRLAEANAGADRNLNCAAATTALTGMALPAGLDHRFRWLDTDGNVLATDATYQATVAGSYVLEASHAQSGCLSYDTVQLRAAGPETLSLEVTTARCVAGENTIRVVAASGGTMPYLYRLEGRSGFQSAGEWNQVPAGSQTVTVQDANGCTLSQTVDVVPEITALVVLVPPLTAQFGVATQIEVSVNRPAEEISQYAWSAPDSVLSCTDCPAPTLLTPQESMTLELTVTDRNGCQVTVPVVITVDRSIAAYLPTAVYPGSRNGINRYFAVFGSEQAIERIVSVTIYDRWGELIFYTSDARLNEPATGWDGTFQGQFVPSGVYLYRVDMLYRDGRSVLESGHFTVLR